MYALSASAEGDCYQCVPPDTCIEAAALGASESSLFGTAPAEALHTFTLDSGASRCFFRDIVAHSSTVLPCPAVLSGSLSGLYLPSFSTNLVSTAALQDSMVTTTTPGGQRVSICTCTQTGLHLATFTCRPGSSLYTLATKPPQVAASAQRAAPHSSSFPPTTAPLQTLHVDSVSSSMSGSARTFLSYVCTLTEVLNLWPRVSLPETSPILRWPRKVGDASVFQVWGSRTFVRDTSANKLSARAVPGVFLGFVPDAPGWQFYHPTSRRVFPSHDVTFDESVPFCRLFPYRSAPPPPPPLFLAPGPPP
ncbi:unnamed protein product, partial [Closterium sp. NIES-54]